MAGYLSTHLANELLDHVLINASYTSPTTVYLALFTDNPTAAGTGTEVTGGSYARQSMSYTAAASGATDTDTDITFTDMPTADVTHWGIYDASTSGNMLIYGAFGVTYSLNSGDDFKVSSGSADISFKTS